MRQYLTVTNAPWAADDDDGIDTVHLILNRLAPSTQRTYSSHVIKFMDFCIDKGVDPFVDDIAAIIVLYPAWLLRHGISGQSISNYLSALKAFFLTVNRDTAVLSTGHLTMARRGAARMVDLSRTRPHRPFPVILMVRILLWGLRAQDSTSIRLATAIVLTFCFLCREHTTAFLEHRDFELTDTQLSIVLRAEKGKPERDLQPRELRIPRNEYNHMLFALFEKFDDIRRGAPTGSLWNLQRKPQPRQINDWLRRVCRILGFGDYTAHDLRHGGTSAAMAIDANPVWVQHTGGWRRIQTMYDTYVHLTEPSPNAWIFFSHLRSRDRVTLDNDLGQTSPSALS